MAVRQREWIQREWTQAGVDLFRERGDFCSLSGLGPDFSRRQLRRAPGWSAHLPTAGLTNIRAMFYDESANRYVLIGTNAASNLAAAYFSSVWGFSAVFELTNATATLGGLSGRNVAYFGGNVYVISSATKVYRGASYTAALAEFYGTNDARILASLGGRLYMAVTSGKIYRLNDANNAFETHFDPVADYSPLYMTAFRGQLTIIGKQDDGNVIIYRLPQSPSGSNPSVLAEAAVVLSASVDYHTYGCLFAVYDDKIYFSPGRYDNVDGTKTVDIYTWNGSQLDRVAQVPDTASDAVLRANGLVNWRGQLLYYALISDSDQVIKMLVGDRFVDFAPGAIDCTTFTPVVAGLAGEIVVSAVDGGAHGVHHAGAATLQDGYLITSRLDMGRPGLQKRLLRVTVLLDGAVADFKVPVRYRIDDTAAWTLATTGNNTQRVAIDITTAVTFYTLQLKIELDDDTGGDEDIRVGAVSVVYSISD